MTALGDRFGQWCVIGAPFIAARGSGPRRRYVLCRCSCGTEHEIAVTRLPRALMCQSCSGSRGAAALSDRLKSTVAERFWANVQKGDGCWEWQASCLRSGYGQFRVNGRNRPTHQVAWELSNGPIPKDPARRRSVCVLHKCDNRRCVNPEHLFLGSHADNVRDCVSKGRHFTPFRKAAS
jgi:hypothetical protein